MDAFNPLAKFSPALCDALVPMNKLWLLCPLGLRISLCDVADLPEKDCCGWVTEPWICIPGDMQARLLQVFGVNGMVVERPKAVSTPLYVVTPSGVTGNVHGAIHARPR